MPKKVVFEFSESSKITAAELEALGFTFREIVLDDGRIVVVPVEPHLTKRAVDVCPACGGYGVIHGEPLEPVECPFCDGSGKRR